MLYYYYYYYHALKVDRQHIKVYYGKVTGERHAVKNITNTETQQGYKNETGRYGFYLRHTVSGKQLTFAGMQPHSHLIIYHIQTLNMAAKETIENDWLVNRAARTNVTTASLT